MKVLSLLSTALVATHAFSPLATTRTATTEVSMAASSFEPDRTGWRNKPIAHKGDRSTPSVASPKAASWLERQTMGSVMIDPDYFLAVAVFLLGPLIMWYHPSYAEQGPSLIGIAGGGFHILFAGLLWVQTLRVRCVFEKDGFEFYNIKGPGTLDLDKGAHLERKPDNYVSGTRNRWRYDKIINYGFFPSLEFPVICYFKETETPKEQWSKWFAAFDSYGQGQPHFFPGICNARQFKEQMEARGVKQKAIPRLQEKK